MPRGSAALARLHRDWLKNLPAQTGKSLSALAKEIKVAPSTFYRPLQEGDNGTSTLNAVTIAKVVDHTGVAPPSELGAPSAGRRARGFGEEAVPYTVMPADPLAAAIAAIVGERNAVVPWLLKSRAVELAGFLPGDLLLLDLNAVPVPGDVVCAQVYDWPHMRAETVVRVFERAPPVELLLARAADPAFAQPLVIDGERVIVKGVFLPHRLRPPQS